MQKKFSKYYVKQVLIFNDILQKGNQMPCEMTPLTYCIYLTPHSDDIIPLLVECGADLYHPSIDKVIGTVKNDLDRLERGAYNTINKILKLRGQDPLPPYYNVNKSCNNIMMKLKPMSNYHKRSIRESKMNNIIVPQKLDGMRYGPSKHCRDENSLYLYIKKFIDNDSSIDTIEITNPVMQKLIFATLIGDISNAEVYNILEKVMNRPFINTKIGSILYKSFGHPTYLSTDRKSIIDRDLENIIGTQLGYQKGDADNILKDFIKNFEMDSTVYLDYRSISVRLLS